MFPASSEHHMNREPIAKAAIDVPTIRASATNRPVRTGFVRGVEDQRLRGPLSTTLAPSPDTVTILGYVAQG